MGDLTLAQMRTEIQYELGSRTDLASQSTRLNRWINTIYWQVCMPTVHPHRELEATVTVPLVADQFEYPLDTGQSYIDNSVLGIRSARYINDTSDSYTASQRKQIHPASIGHFNKRTHTTNDQGPSHYTISRNSLIITPGPTSSNAGNVVVLEVWEKPTVLINSTDTTVLLDYWDEAIVRGAKWLAASTLEYGPSAENFLRDYQDLVNVFPNREDIGFEDEEGHFPDINRGQPIMPRS